jgi:hypothetical protein
MHSADPKNQLLRPAIRLELLLNNIHYFTKYYPLYHINTPL